MPCQADIQKCIEGGDHLQHEASRVGALHKWPQLISTDQAVIAILPNTVTSVTEKALVERKVCLHDLNPNQHTQGEYVETSMRVTAALKNLQTTLADIVPEYKRIDIQTTDAGPGVGLSESMARLRLVENFLIKDLDFECRMHFAPRESKSHPVE